MIRMQIQLTAQQARTLRELAHQEQVSLAELVRRARDHWLRKRWASAGPGRFWSADWIGGDGVRTNILKADIRR